MSKGGLSLILSKGDSWSMKRGITRIALVAIAVLGVFAASALVVAADPELPTDPIPPMDQPGQRVAFWLTRLPKQVYVDQEAFDLRFTAFPMTGAVLVWNVDMSTSMTIASRFEDGTNLDPQARQQLASILSNQGYELDAQDPLHTLQEIWPTLSEAEHYDLLTELDQFGFRYEPWASALDMLQGFWTETGLCDGMLALVAGPGGTRMVHHPCLAPRTSVEMLVEHGPTGWYEFTQGLTETLSIATQYADQGFPVELFVVNRGPLLDTDRDRIPEMVDQALARGIQVNVVPMGNEPGSRKRYPYLKPLRELAEATGGSVYYAPNLQNVHDFSMLTEMVPQMMQDFYGRMGQVNRGTTVASRATLVLSPSEHVRFLSPSLSQSATGTASVRIPLQNLTIGEPQSVDLRLRVSTNITQTLLPVFQGTTDWADPRHSYFEWVDQGGLPHRLPIPQRVISVTTGTVRPAAPSPTPIPTSTPRPSPTPLPTATPWPTPTATATATPRPTITPWPTPTASPTPPRANSFRDKQFYIALIVKNRENKIPAAYPVPGSAPTRVEIPVLDALVRRLFP